MVLRASVGNHKDSPSQPSATTTEQLPGDNVPARRTQRKLRSCLETGTAMR